MELGRAYSVLGIEPGVSRAALRHAYYGQLRRHHPDTGSGDVAALARVRNAYRILAVHPAVAPAASSRPAPRVTAVASPPERRLHVDVYA